MTGFPASDYYGGSAPFRPDRSTVDPAGPPHRLCGPGQERNGSRVHCLIACWRRRPALPPRHRHGYPAALHRGLRAVCHTRPRSSRPEMRGPDAPQPANPPGSSWWFIRRLQTPVPHVRLSISLAGPAPSGSAGTSRHRQGRLPPEPGTSRVRLLLNSNRPAATRRRRRSLTSDRSNSASRRTWP